MNRHTNEKFRQGLCFQRSEKICTIYAIVMFFLLRPFNDNFKFVRIYPNYFHRLLLLHSHYTPKGFPACSMASKLLDWDLRNIVKISPKMTRKQPFLDFFRFSQKLFIRFERKFLQSFYIIYRVLYVHLHQYRKTGIWETKPKLAKN